MSRLTQIAQSLFVRLEGLLYQLFGFLGQIFGWLNQRFNFLRKIFGFTESQYFLEDSSQVKLPEAQSDLMASPPQYSPPSATRRRPDANMEYYLKLARPEKKEKTSS